MMSARAKAATVKHSRAPLITKPRGDAETTRLIHIDRHDLELVAKAAKAANKSTGWYIAESAILRAKRDLA